MQGSWGEFQMGGGASLWRDKGETHPERSSAVRTNAVEGAPFSLHISHIPARRMRGGRPLRKWPLVGRSGYA
jgi:hypothetical protein